MIELARRNNQFENCTFHLNSALNLGLFPDDHFDLVYSNIVLQHVHPSCSKRYLAEFIRVLKPQGMAVFQLPSEPADPSWRRQHEAMAKRAEPQPARHIEMYGIHRDEVVALVQQAGAIVELIEPNQNAGKEWIGFRYFVRKPKSSPLHDGTEIGGAAKPSMSSSATIR
jgi:ubiquinone/menaquinone biosynthesis C-methylase UbiE